MLSMLSNVQILIYLAIALVALGMAGVALFDAARQRPDAFAAAGKLTKGKWVGILSVAFVLGLLALPPAQILFFGLGCMVAAGVYLADVRPALRRVTGGGYRSW